MIAPKFILNRSYGLFIDGGVCISLVKPMVERNDDGGHQPHIRLRGQDSDTRGCGIIMGIHAERDGATDGLLVERWRGLRLQNGDLLWSHVTLAPDALDNIVEGMSLRGSVIHPAGPTNIRRYNIVANDQGR
jgi:hypothetical protein